MKVSVETIIADLEGRGVQISLQNGEIRLKGPLDGCAEQIGKLREAREALNAFLKSRWTERDGMLVDRRKGSAFTAIPNGSFVEMLELDRFIDRAGNFDRIISASEKHYWNPLDDRYLDLSLPFDVANEPIFEEGAFACLHIPAVQERLADRAERARFINKIAWIRLSGLLHGEQGALNLSASLCAVLTDQGAQEYAANQTREEARHVTAFARYIKCRFGQPAPCTPPLRDFMREIVESEDATKKIIGMQVIIEGMAMGSLGSLYKILRDPSGKRLVQLVMTDEAFHHKFGRMWVDDILPTLSALELARVQAWTDHCLKDFIVRMNPPLELHVLQKDFGLDPFMLHRELCKLPPSRTSEGLGTRETFRVLTTALLDSGLLSEQSKYLYAQYISENKSNSLQSERDFIVEQGLEFLSKANLAQNIQ